jgi:hypothetical protein
MEFLGRARDQLGLQQIDLEVVLISDDQPGCCGGSQASDGGCCGGGQTLPDELSHGSCGCGH